MPEFAKSLFSFGGFNKSKDSAALQQALHSSPAIASPTASTANRTTSSLNAEFHSFGSSSMTPEGPSGASTPTIDKPPPRTNTGSTLRTSDAQMSDAMDSTEYDTNSPTIAENSDTTTGSASADSDPSSAYTSILGPEAAKQPIGKLTIRILQARDLSSKSSNPCPYVVCTYDSSEFVTNGPASHSDSSSHHPTGIAIPSKFSKDRSQRQTSSGNGTNPSWKDAVVFDVTSADATLEISVYDSSLSDAFLGHARFRPNLLERESGDKWLQLRPRVRGERVTGEVEVQIAFERVAKNHIGPDDFEVLRLVGKGTFGQVYQVRKKDTKRIYAMKVLSKKVIVQKKEIAHTIGERNILASTASSLSPFVVGLKFSFQTPSDLYLVTDYMSGGELFWHLQKEGRFAEERAKFYIAELIVALEHLHNNGIVYRDLKPENILLDANGHIALCDFGLSKANLSANGTTNTFCGTTEYLAPEVLLDDQGYTKMVDFWSLGVLVFEMCCGWSPFYAEDTQQMYKNIAFGKVRFPKDALSAEGRNFVKGLLNRNPKHRLGAIDDARELRAHPFFDDIDWDLLKAKLLPPPFKPQLSSETDTSNFDPEFTQASTSVLHRAFLPMATTPLSPGIQANFQGFTYVDESSMDDQFRGRLGTSLKPTQQDDDIELYDDNDINNITDYYNTIAPSTTSVNSISTNDPNISTSSFSDIISGQNNPRRKDDDVGMIDDEEDFAGQLEI